MLHVARRLFACALNAARCVLPGACLRIMLSVARCASSVVCAACCASCCVSHVARRRLCARCVLRVTLLVSGHVARCTLQIMLYVACCTRLDAGLHVAGLYAARCGSSPARWCCVLHLAGCTSYGSCCTLRATRCIVRDACRTLHLQKAPPACCCNMYGSMLHVAYYDAQHTARVLATRQRHCNAPARCWFPPTRSLTGTAACSAHAGRLQLRYWAPTAAGCSRRRPPWPVRSSRSGVPQYPAGEYYQCPRHGRCALAANKQPYRPFANHRARVLRTAVRADGFVCLRHNRQGV